MTGTEIRKYAQRLAQDCIDDWAHEDRGELNDLWETDFSDDEIDEIVRLASASTATLPHDEETT